MDVQGISPAFGDTSYLMLGALLLFLILFAAYLRREGRRRKSNGAPTALRPIAGYARAREGFATAAETGRAVHVSPGTGSFTDTGVRAASTLAGMSVVEAVSRVSAITGAPLQATTNAAVTFALTENALRKGYQRAGWPLENESGGARFLTHNDSIAYMAAASEVASRNKVSQAVMAGHFGPEVLFLMEAQRRTGAVQIAGSSDPQGLAVMSVSADHTLTGEEIFASGAYLEHRASHVASLLSQDGLRWAIVLLIIAGFILVNVLGQSPTQLLSYYP
ncbi:MAG TPA: DUF6754 domain-containing protein [Chloroflexia bacterium]|nr:DUF6754 domain-containing protein [Chloroflexia bacterium]